MSAEPDLLSLFQEEADARLVSLSDLLLRLEAGEASTELIHSMFREAHTIKGSAAVTGLDEISREAHVLEELLDRLRNGEWEITPDVVDTILSSVDTLTKLITGNRPAGALAPEDEDDQEDEDEDDVAESEGSDAEPASDDPTKAIFRRRSEDRQTTGTARVAVERLDDLVRVAGESTAAHLRLARVLHERIGADAAVETEVRALTRLLTELHEKTLRARMLPIGTVSAQLRRAVRDMGRAAGKTVRFEFRGEDTELDRRVHERLADALIHLVRNSVDHGVEPPEAREQAGKPAEASVVVHAMQLGSRVIVTVTDDGRGIDADSVRRNAIQRLAIDARHYTDEQVKQLIFEPGLSTAAEVTDVSGRGVGLDAVRQMIEELRGRIEVFSTPGKGTTFRIGVPITLAVLKGLVVDAAGTRFAVPMHAVTSVLSRDTQEIMVEGSAAVRAGGLVVALDHLADVLDVGEGGRGPIVVMAGLSRTHAFRVDTLMGQRELVVKGLPLLVPADDVVVGGSAEPDGSIMLVLDPDGLIEAAARRNPALSQATAMARSSAGTASGAPRVAAAPVSRGRVIVVDDALTVRELQRSILERAGFDVRTAIDGIEALEKLEEGVDIVLTDIEMPRMDGLTLTRSIRKHPKWGNLPIVMLTTRASAADRQAGMDAGADAYIVKSAFTESALLGVVESLLGTRES